MDYAHNRIQIIKMMLATLLILVLMGCATSKEIVLPSGQKGHSIDCSGSAIPIAKCYEKAGELCPNGYNIISGNNDKTVGTNLDGSPLFFNNKGILVECK